MHGLKTIEGPKGQGSAFSEAFHNYKAVRIKAGLITPIFIGQGVVSIFFGLVFSETFPFHTLILCPLPKVVCKFNRVLTGEIGERCMELFKKLLV